jgi:hypothetical protein
VVEMPITRLCYYHKHDILDGKFRDRQEAIIRHARMIDFKLGKKQHLRIDIQIHYQSGGKAFFNAELKGGAAVSLMRDFEVKTLRELSGKKLYAHLDRYGKVLGFSAYLNQ